MTDVPAWLENEGGISYLEALAESMSEPEEEKPPARPTKSRLTGKSTDVPLEPKG